MITNGQLAHDTLNMVLHFQESVEHFCKAVPPGPAVQDEIQSLPFGLSDFLLKPVILHWTSLEKFANGSNFVDCVLN